MSINNNNKLFGIPNRIFNDVIKISILSFLLLFFSFSIHNIIVYGQKSDFPQLVSDDHGDRKNYDLNLVAVGDFYCNDETEDTIENIISIDPELIITTGDHVK